MRDNDSLTSLRGIAACSVVLFHFAILLPHLELPVRFPFLNRSHLWVDFFFMLSGYVMMLVYGETLKIDSWKSIGEFYWARLARIYPLHLVVLLILIGLEFAVAAFGQSNSDPFTLASRSFDSIWTNLLLIQSWHLHLGNTWNIPSWSISCEWAAYLVFPFVVAKLRENQTKHKWSILLTCVGSLIILERWYGSLSMSFDWGVARCLGSFIAGATIFELLKRSYATDFGNSVVYVFVLGLPFAALPIIDWLDIEWLAIPVFLVLLTVMSKARSPVRFFLLENRPMFYLGELSYAIYISHWIVQSTVPALFVRFVLGTGHRPSSTGTDTFLLLAMIVSTVIISVLLHVLVEKPAQTCLRNVLRSGSNDRK